MKKDVRFHINITEEDIQGFCQYYWELGKSLDELIISREQAMRLIRQITGRKNVLDKRTKAYRKYLDFLNSELVSIYETDFGTVVLTVKE